MFISEHIFIFDEALIILILKKNLYTCLPKQEKKNISAIENISDFYEINVFFKMYQTN